jgi:hypothetical protein
MPRSLNLSKSLFLVLLGLISPPLQAHSIPEIPVRTEFKTGGQMELSIEIDPRNWESSPAEAPSLEFKTFMLQPQSKKDAQIARTKQFIADSIEFTFEPLGNVQPDFTWDFVAETGKPLLAMTDAVVARGKWKTTVPAGITGWKIRSKPGHKVSVVFINTINGQAHPRVPVLFPGESSFTLDLTGLTAGKPTQPSAGSVSAHADNSGAWNTFIGRIRDGFEHILPEGLDHILFVLGLFLLCRAWKPILIQVTTFTVAHTITLALATLGYVSIAPRIVEPIIAASIAVVALENIFRPTYGKFRLLLVFIFGLIHGLGFAQKLLDERIPSGSIVSSLLGFNLGVEFGQLAVIGLAVAATFWIKDEEKYRGWVVIPASTLIAVAGLFWAYQRVS